LNSHRCVLELPVPSILLRQTTEIFEFIPLCRLLNSSECNQAVKLVDAVVRFIFWSNIRSIHLNFRIGFNHYSYPVHQDWTPNILVQLWGTKRIKLGHPDCVPCEHCFSFATAAAASSSQAVVEDDASFHTPACPRKKEPAAAGSDASIDTYTLEPGSAIFIPAGWWHAVKAESQISLSLNYFLSIDPTLPASPSS
jgi:ribosomal protein L16 Arg81 hydroxylase